MKILRTIKYLLLTFVTLSLGILVYSFYTVPDELCVVQNEQVSLGSIYSLSLVKENISEKDIQSLHSEGDYKINVSLFNTIPVKEMNMKISKRQYVVVSGNIFGLRLFTNGVVIASTSSVETVNGAVSPSANAGLAAGDVIISINGTDIKNCKEVIDIFAKYDGTPVEIVFVRNGKKMTAIFELAFSKTEKKYLAGLWIRDSAAGIGTMTFYDKKTGVYAGLGHGVCDADTNNILPLYEGDIVNADVNGCYKGKSGEAGELCGTFSGGRCGSLCLNCQTGVYGFLDSADIKAKEIPVAKIGEVKTGKAQIISTVDGDGPKYYDIEIEKINAADASYRNMVIKITDKQLIEKTGGIVQGMSGSPIIQNGMLVGAVTHVFINQPLNGYGIFAEHMLKQADELSEVYQKAS